MQKIIISILHYNSNRDTLACLASLMDSNLNGLEIKTYVLDNASRETLDIDVSTYKKIGLSIIKSKINLGFTGGHNLVYKNTKDVSYDFFLLLNNDSIVDSNLLQEMVKAGHEKKVGAVVPKIYFTKGMEFHKNRYSESDMGKVFWYAGGKLDWDHVMSIHRGVDEVDVGQFDKQEEIDFATGACLLIKKEVLNKIGLFDRRYFLYYEDADLSVRIRKADFEIMYCPHAVAWHNNAGSSGSGSELHDYYLTRNRMLFGIKFAPIRTKFALIRESFRLLLSGRRWQRIGIKDYYLKKFGKGSY
ncbi:MAG: glycosyltransferase family 2 protein [Candidatus Levybacteria bacterium]|nr:glycosyltransferase family 2 protein [Candidatus Levybacteria bacterium]